MQLAKFIILITITTYSPRTQAINLYIIMARITKIVALVAVSALAADAFTGKKNIDITFFLLFST